MEPSQPEDVVRRMERNGCELDEPVETVLPMPVEVPEYSLVGDHVPPSIERA
jgi:hypothetical protein